MMAGNLFPRCSTRLTPATLAAVLALMTIPQAHATNLFNLYVGAAYARSNLRAKDSIPIPFGGAGPFSRFDRSDSGYQFSLGARGLDLLGADVARFPRRSPTTLGEIRDQFLRRSDERLPFRLLPVEFHSSGPMKYLNLIIGVKSSRQPFAFQP